MKNNSIIININGLDKGVQFTVNTILEEFIHLKYKVSDETRDFQDRTFDEFYLYMKKFITFVTG